MAIDALSPGRSACWIRSNLGHSIEISLDEEACFRKLDCENNCGDKNLSPLQAKPMTLMLLQRVGPVSYMVPGKFCLKDPVIYLFLVYSRNGQRHGCGLGCSDQNIG